MQKKIWIGLGPPLDVWSLAVAPNETFLQKIVDIKLFLIIKNKLSKNIEAEFAQKIKTK